MRTQVALASVPDSARFVIVSVLHEDGSRIFVAQPDTVIVPSGEWIVLIQSELKHVNPLEPLWIPMPGIPGDGFFVGEHGLHAYHLCSVTVPPSARWSIHLSAEKLRTLRDPHSPHPPSLHLKLTLSPLSLH